MVDVAHMDDDAAMAFCDALQANTTLDTLVLSRVDNLMGFRGRTLPTSLRHFEWNACFHDPNVDDATINHLAMAVGPTKLHHFGCSVFGKLAQCMAAAPMLAQLTCLEVHALPAAGVEALIAGLSTVPALTTLGLEHCAIAKDDAAVQLMAALATSCTRLSRLQLKEHAMYHDGVAAVLTGALRLPQLTWLDVSPRFNAMALPNLLYILMELVAAGRHARELHLKTAMRQITINGDRSPLGDDKEHKRAVLRALAMIHDPTSSPMW
ncbi:hypothetical protein SPRG_13881 [Saprolegnia parasitica CBS 223.65]|uniref:F-box domain-containing protein n=1 Tax=Saprolegnia parasitica (strain CBS 223.65) TaxID=695850 RepID=A0A067BRU5_SAPPC|nr:hypothetical protein SPRG_13881 [Saprolegnia parasitica CBS 223.65]KDO20988.1 hypothetical protein SPRG_13881 [Saprolegnia parasitica CBS 223.65]|eukprot:XP_012208300.1 hypothetical protein SPRG_13881 [Saprolegnia parasitica CBS 223.65]